MSAKLKVKKIDGYMEFGLIGELDHHYTEDIKIKMDAEILNTENIKRVVFDMSQVTFMDSSGIGLIIGRYKKLCGKGTVVEIKGAKNGIDRILTMSGIYQIIKKVY